MIHNKPKQVLPSRERRVKYLRQNQEIELFLFFSGQKPCIGVI